MADSSVDITAGSGTSIDTRTESTNSNHRQVIVVGDPATNAGVAPVDGTAGLKVDLGADNDVTVTGTVDLGATDNAVLDAISSASTAINNAISGSEMQVDLVGITPDLALGTDISDVFGTASLVLGTQADNVANTSDGLQVTNFNYVFDGSTWDRLRGDSTNGMLVNLGSNNDVTVTGTVTVDLGANNDVTVTGTVDLGATDNAVLDQIDSNTDYGAVTGGGVEASALRVTLANDSTGVLSVDDNGGSLTVDGTVTANLGATDNAVLDQIETNTSYGDNTGGGTESGALRVTLANNSTGVLSIDDNGGSITVDGTVTADLGANNDVTVSGENAHDGTTLGNPVLGGARATNSVEGLTQVANADLTHIQADLNGVLLQRPHTTLEEIVAERANVSTSASLALTNFAAGGAGVHNYITTISVVNATGTSGLIDISDASASANGPFWTVIAPASGGSNLTFDPPLKQPTANTALHVKANVSVDTIYVNINGFQAQG